MDDGSEDINVTTRNLKLITTREHFSQRLDETLSEWLTTVLKRPVSKAKARKLIVAGVVRVNGRPVRIASQELSPRLTIEAAVDLSRLFADAASQDRQFRLTAKHILFEDEDLIAVDKPAGLPSHPTVDESRNNLFGAVRQYLHERDGTDYLGIHHRLDRDTSGVIVFTKSKRINAPMADLFSKHLATKVYQALTARGRVDREWTISNRLAKISSNSGRAAYGVVRTAGQFAETAFRLIAQHSGGLWIEAIPKTGRTHQIRVHLSEMGLPILGDDLYGGNGGDAPRLMLHATQLKFSHPLTKRDIVIESPLHADFLRCLRDLEKPPTRS